MSAFPTPIPPPDAEGASRRTVPRAKMADLAAMDIDTLRERFHQTRRDERGPITKFLDLLDSPRQVIATNIFPGLERRARERGDIGAGGVGKVYGSDVMGELGIDNRVGRAVLGTALDLAWDPLTYIGPPGWGLKVTNRAGQGVRIGLRGKRAIAGGIKELGAGEAVSNPLVRGLVDATGATNAAEASERVLGKVTSGKTGQLLSRVGGTTDREGGALAEQFRNFDAGNAAGEASRSFVREYGRGAAPGIRIGKDATGKLRITVGKATADGPVATSTIAHIPFTEWGIHVPSFTGEGKAAGDELRIATSTGRVDPVRASGRTVATIAPMVSQIERIGSAHGQGFLTAEDATAQIEDLNRQIGETLKAGALPAEPENIGELLSLRKLIDEGEAASAYHTAKVEAGHTPGMHELMAEANQRYADAVKGSVKQFASEADESQVRITKQLLETDDDIIGASALTPLRAAAAAAHDPGVAVDILNRADNAGKGIFGQPGGMLRSQARYLKNTLTSGSREVFNSTEHEIRRAVVDAMDGAGLADKTPEDYQTAAQLTFAHMYDLRNKQALADGKEPVFYTTKHASSEPAEWVDMLDKAQKGGLFAKGASGSLSDQLRKVAEKYVAAMDTLGSEEYADKVLGKKSLLRGYVPTVSTPEAKARIGAIANQQVKDGHGSAIGRASENAREGFQKPRSTLQYRYQTEDGIWRRFFEKDRWVEGITPKELALIGQEDARASAHIADLKQAIADYDRLAADPKWAAANAPRNTDPWELNDMVNSGAFSLLVGGAPFQHGFADTNIATAMASRFMSHERAVARRTWLQYVKQFGVAVDPAEMQGKLGADGASIILKDGSVAKTYTDHATGLMGVEQMGMRYRPLQKSVQDLKKNPLIQGMGDTVAKVYHEDVARMIEDMANLYEKDGGPLLKMMDTANGAWKTATLFSPTWTLGNIAGDGLNFLMGGAKIADITRNAPVMAKIVAGANNPEALKDLSLTIRGVTVPAVDFVNDLRANRLLGNNRHAETALQLINRKFFVMPSQVAGAEARGALADLRPSALKADFLQRLSHEAGASRVAAGAKAAGFVARDRLMRRVIGPWFKINEKVSDYMRALAYASFLEQGHDIPAAVQRTIRAGFDYQDATRVERAAFKRVWPFYSWMRLNGAYQLKLLAERPIYAGSFPILQNALEEALAGDREVPMHARPAWMRNQLALMVGSDPEDRVAVMLGQSLPLEQALVAGGAITGIEGVQDFARYFLTSLTPVVRSPAEFAAGREFFSGRTIDPSGDITPGQFIADQFRPLKETQKITEAVRKQGVAQGVGRLFLGGRLQAADDERLVSSRVRELKEEEAKLRNAAQRAERAGDAATRAVRMAQLLKLYESAMRSGLEKNLPVPKWARERLAMIAQ